MCRGPWHPGLAATLVLPHAPGARVLVRHDAVELAHARVLLATVRLPKKKGDSTCPDGVVWAMRLWRNDDDDDYGHDGGRGGDIIVDGGCCSLPRMDGAGSLGWMRGALPDSFVQSTYLNKIDRFGRRRALFGKLYDG